MPLCNKVISMFFLLTQLDCISNSVSIFVRYSPVSLENCVHLLFIALSHNEYEVIIDGDTSIECSDTVLELQLLVTSQIMSNT